jgi:hypothetical protein
MHVASIILSVALALALTFTGSIKVLNTSMARENAAHLKVSTQRFRLIGIAELAAVVGLLAGIAIKPLAIVTAAAVCLLMAGALGYHAKARDNFQAMLPAIITEAMAVAVVVLTILA